jgi:radical SAM protein with 4Fe4S-binding SPASM domain
VVEPATGGGKDLSAELHRDYSYYSFGKWLYHGDRVAKVREGKFREVMPVTVQLVPTLYCNFGCPRCSYGQAKEDIELLGQRKMMTMDYGTMATVIDRLDHAGIKAIVFTGGGEPTLNPHFLDGMRYAGAKGFRLGLFTNGSLLNREKIVGMLQLEPTFVRVSLDAGSPVAHRLLHGYSEKHDYLTKILRNVELMAKEKQRRGLQTTIGIGVSVEPINLHDLVQVAERLREIAGQPPTGGIDYLVFRPMVNYDRGKFYHMAEPLLTYLKEHVPEYYQDYWNYMYKGAQLPARLFEQANEIIDTEVSKALDGTGVQVINIRTKMLGITRADRPHQKCRASSWYIFVGPDGTVYNCVELGLDPRVAIGNLLSNSLAEIWQSRRRREVLEYIDREGLHTLCPPVCLYYELNNLFEKLDAAFRAGNKAKDEVLQWIAEQEALVQAEMASGKFTQMHREFL